MTHNLRTPLASIKAAVSTLQDTDVELDDATRARLLRIAHDEAERLERLVNKVLELSRIHAGVLEPRREPTDVGELARGAVRRLRHLAARDRVRLTVAGDVLVVVGRSGDDRARPRLGCSRTRFGSRRRVPRSRSSPNATPIPAGA